MEQEPSAPPHVPDPPHLLTSVSPSLQAAALMAQGDVSKLRRDGDYMQQEDIRFTVTPHKCFSHYDVQSVLLSISEPFSLQKLRRNVGASAASRCTGQQDYSANVAVCDDPSEFSDDDDGKSSSLVLSCPLFSKEIGGETEKSLGLTRAQSAAADKSELPLGNRPTHAGVSVLEACRETQVFPQNLLNNSGIEHFDHGANYYLKYFYNKDHQNYFGTDKNFGPVSVSVRREKLDEGTQYNYRLILRTSQLFTLRGSILEDSVPSSSKHGTGRGLPMKDVLEFVFPELKVQSLRRATSSPRVPELLLQLDQQELNFQHNVALRFCQTSEDQTRSPALDQFLDLLGHRVPLESFANYQLHLDTSGAHSVYTKFREFELKFNVATLLPYTPSDTQQLSNNSVTVIFQEPDAPPFDPQILRSHFHHVFIVIRVHRPCSQHTCYSVAVSRSRELSYFGPFFPPGWMFPASPAFRDFLLTKIINAEHAVRRSATFVTLMTRRRRQRLKDLVENFSTSMTVDSASSIRFSFISFGGKKKDRSVRRPRAHLQSVGGLTWTVTARDFRRSTSITCRLAISNELVVLIEEASRQVVFSCYCRDVLGWSFGHGGVKLFYQQGDCVMFSTQNGSWEDVQEIIQRLQLLTRGAATADMTLRRNHQGQLGFHVNFEGIVADVEANGLAWEAGLRPGCRLMEICTVALVTLSHEQIIELLRKSATVSVVVIPPHRDGTPRRSFSESYRVPMFELPDGTFCPIRVAPPTWHQMSLAPSTPRVPSSAESDPEQQLSPVIQRSSFDMKEGPSSPSSQSSELGPHVIHRRPLPDWSISSDDSTESILEKTRRIRSRDPKSRPHPHPHPVMKILREFQLTDSESSSTLYRVPGKSCSSCSNSNTLSSSSSDGRHSTSCLTDLKGTSLDSGIDSAAFTSLAPVPGGTLVLRDVWEEEQTRGSDPTSCDQTEPSETCSLPSVCGAPRNSSPGRLKMSSSVDSPEMSVTCTIGSVQDARRPDIQEIFPQGLKGLNKSDCDLLLEEVTRLSRCSFREEFLKMMQCEVPSGETAFVSSVLPLSTSRALSRTMSDDSLYRRLSPADSSMSLLSDNLPPNIRRRPPTLHRRRLYHSDSSLVDRRQKSLLQASSKVVYNRLEDLAQSFRAAGALSEVHQLRHTQASQSSTLQDSDIPRPSLSGKVGQLEDVLQRMQLDLLQEQQDKAALQQQVLSLRQDNLRLQQESRSTAEQIRRFATWMLHQGALP